MKNNYFMTKALAFSFAFLFLFSCSEEQTNLEMKNETTLSNNENGLISKNLMVLENGEPIEGLTDQLLFESIINGVVEPSECDVEDDEFGDWFSSTLDDWTNTDISNYLAVDDFNLETNYVFFLQDPNSPQHYGVNGQYTDVLNSTFDSLKGFWDINSDDIRMLGMHSIHTDVEKMTELLTFYGNPEDISRQAAEEWAAIFSQEQFDFGDHPIFTLNAFAVTSPALEFDMIAMGDGIMEGYEAIGLGDIAPQAILAHEYAHQIQFATGFRGDFGNAPENTRYNELMADAYASYFLTHQKGQGMEAKKVSEFTDVFFAIGDCSFTSSGHHGTFLQREKASQFGMKLAKANQRRGIILSSSQFFEMYKRVFRTLL